MLPRNRSAIADHLALMYGPMQRVRELVEEGRFRLNILNTADPILEREPPSSALVKGFGVAWERLLSARLLPFGQPALSAHLRRPTPRSAMSAIRRLC